MSKSGWTLWGSIQHSVSSIDFDFWSWVMEKYDRAVAEFDGADRTTWDAAGLVGQLYVHRECGLP